VLNYIQTIPTKKFALFFLFISLFFQVIIFNGKYPYVYLTSDAANIASFVAANENPDSFREDEALGNSNNYKFYQTIHIYLLPKLKKIFGDHGTAFHSLAGIHLFLQLFGFFLLGKLLFKDNLYAVFFTFVLSINMPSGFQTCWGHYHDPIPRISFQAFLPFLLLLVFKAFDKPKNWWFVMFLTGMLTYVHPVGSPVWGIAIGICIILFVPKKWTLIKKLSKISSIFLVYILTILPFILNYAHYHQHGTTNNYSLIMQIFNYRFHQDYINIPRTLIKFFFMPSSVFLISTLLLILFFLYINKKLIVDKNLKALFILFFSILISTSFFSILDHVIAKSLKVIPFEIDLARSIRFLFPIWILMIFYLMDRFAKQDPKKQNIIKYSFVFFITLNLLLPNIRANVRVFSDWANGNFFSLSQKRSSALNIYKFLKILPANRSAIINFSSLDDLPIRYYSLKPLVYSFKDGAILGYANHHELIKWYRRSLIMDEYKNKKNKTIYDQIKIARKFNARYIVSNISIIKKTVFPNNSIVLMNKHYCIIDVKNL